MNRRLQDTHFHLSVAANGFTCCPAGTLIPARRIPSGRLPRGELLNIAFVFAKNARKYLKLALCAQTVRYLLRSANPSRNKKFQPLVQIVRQGSRGQCVHAPGCFNGASPALPRRPSGLLGRARDPISFPLRFVGTSLKQILHGANCRNHLPPNNLHKPMV